MARNHSVSTKSSQKSPQSNNTGVHSQRFHGKNHRVIQFEPFCLLSPSDGSLKRAAEMVESVSLNRFKVCVVSIVSKDAIDKSVKEQIAHSILARSNHDENTCGKRKQRHNSATSDGDMVTGSLDNETSSSNLIGDYENQVIGQIDSKNDVIVLNLTSMFETDQLGSIIQQKSTKDLFDPQPDIAMFKNSKLLDVWPLLNQNLIKILLILLTMSHIVVFYNPELAIDYNLILTLKILENMRLKSQNRLLDLLETIASKHTFPQQWIRQGRVSCPRALFVCGTNNLDFDIKQNEFANVKRSLEDQIHRLLKKTNLIFRPPTSGATQQTTLLSLPPRDDFVFILVPNEGQLSSTRSKILPNTKKSQEVDFYSKLFKSFTLNDKKNISDNSLENTSFQNIQDEASIKFNMSIQNKLRRFLLRHISDIQAASHIDSDGKQNSSSKLSSNSIFLPRYDDFFSVLLRLKCLLMPATQVGEETSDQFSHHAIKWSLPDERRFVDIFDSVNTDELFSKRHCQKTRIAAYDFYVREMQIAQPTAKAHETSLDSARKLYLNHARGSACDPNLQILIEQCNQYWQNIIYTKFTSDETKKDSSTKSNRLARARSSETAPASNNANTTKEEVRGRTGLSINRRANGINMTASCECGRQSTFMIVPVDRKKKLERVDIYKNND